MVFPPDEDWSQPFGSQFLVHAQEVDLNLMSDNIKLDLVLNLSSLIFTHHLLGF